MSSVIILFIVLCTSLHILTSYCNDCSFVIGNIGVISSKDNSRWSRSVVGATHLAINDYNTEKLYGMDHISSNIKLLKSNPSNLSNTSLITGCKIQMDARSADFSSSGSNAIKTGITEMFDLTQLYQDKDSNINVPIMLGPPWSAMSIPSNPLINAFNMIQLSASATSTALTGYDSFFRTIPTDCVQAKALILLCKHFEWNSIGIIYENTDYGSTFHQELISSAQQYVVETQSFGFLDQVTMDNAIKNAQNSGLFIFVIIATLDHHTLFSEAVEKYDMVSYPYFYLGVDSVFSSITDDIKHIYGGIIGSCPWNPSINDIFESEYPYPLNISSKMYADYYKSWINMTMNMTKYNRWFYNVSEPVGIYAVYSYDTVIAVIKTIDKYIELNAIKSIQQFESIMYDDIAAFAASFKDILKKIWFIGLTGNVSFDEYGDRRGGIYAFCNYSPLNGTIKKIGFVIGNDIVHVDENQIEWPLEFQKHGIIPSVQYCEYPGMATLSILPTIIWCISFLSIFVALLYVWFLFYYRKKKIIRASQWQLNIIMLCGCIIAYVTVIIYGIDESHPYKDIFLQNAWNWLILCNARILLLNISFGFIFGSLLCKVWRIRRIFDIRYDNVRLSANIYRMILYNFIYVFIETMIVVIMIILIPNNRVYIESKFVDDDHFTEYYGSCSTDSDSEYYIYIYYVVLFVPKLIVAIYCIGISLIVYSTVSVMKYNEGLHILFVVSLSILLISITVCILSTTNVDNPSSSLFYTAFLSSMILIICNVASSIMLLPRFIAIWKDIDTVYESKKHRQMQKIQTFMNEMRERVVQTVEITDQISAESPKTNTKTDNVELDMFNFTKKN